jgi:hypothetical protein
MAAKPDFSRLGSRLAKKEQPAVAEGAMIDAQANGMTPDAPKGYRLDGKPRQRVPRGSGTTTDPRKSALVRLDKQTWRALKELALDDDRPLQDLMSDAVHDYLRKRGAISD